MNWDKEKMTMEMVESYMLNSSDQNKKYVLQLMTMDLQKRKPHLKVLKEKIKMR